MVWEPAQEIALALAFEGRWTQEEMVARIAERGDGSAKFRISTRTLRAWMTHPDFRARLDELRANFATSVRDVTYADKARRVIALSEMAESARREYEARPWLQERRPVLVKRLNVSTLPNGEDAQGGNDAAKAGVPTVGMSFEEDYIVIEHFNKDAHSSFLAALDDIAKELGERRNVTQVSGTVDVTGRVAFYLPQPELPPAEAVFDADVASVATGEPSDAASSHEHE